MSEYFKDQPEFIELDLGESLISRTETLASFRELGPPDLCHVIKTTGRAGQKDIGSYHYVSGVDASSSASLAAYINSLTYTVEETSSWFFGSSAAKSGWRVRGGAFCSFNAFSRVDVRVEVKIPGGVEAYAIDVRGERHEATSQMWQEVYLSAILRAILYADDPSYRLAGFRKLDPISSVDAELRFVAAAETAFFKGWQLGSEPEVQVATVVSNHLATGLMKYFGDSARYGPLINLFEKLVVKEGEVACLLAQSYLGMNEEVKAVRVLQSAIQQHPQSYALLHVQCDFLRSKGRTEWALKLAKEAVNCAPSEFVTWAKLTEVNMELGRYTDALLTLNSCPMFTWAERDLHRMPTPAKSHLPIKDFIASSGILDDENTSAHSSDADVALLRLPAPSLRGTFAKAYVLLAKLVSLVGWDELLKCRSQVFVMEEEYRAHRAADGSPESPLVPNGTSEAAAGLEETEGPGPLALATDDEASEKAPSVQDPEEEQPEAVSSIPTIAVNGQTEDGEQVDDDSSAGADIPTIKVSTESDGEREREELKRFEESEAGRKAREVVGKPNQAKQAPEEDGDSNSNADAASDGKSSSSSPTIQNKRLCERWLDNLFMVLYEDLRIFTIWRAEVAHFKAQHLPYRKTGTEWEILGELAQRLHHRDEAKDAFQRALDQKFSAKAWLKLLEMYVEEGDVQRSLNAAIRLSVYQHRWYMEQSYPTAVAKELFKLIRRDGLAKISYSLVSMNIPQPILKTVMQPYFAYAQNFRGEFFAPSPDASSTRILCADLYLASVFQSLTSLYTRADMPAAARQPRGEAYDVPAPAILAGGYHHPLLRSLQAERHLTKDMLMYPIFITDEPDAEVEIKSLPGQKRWGINRLQGFLAPLVAKGLRSVILFGVPVVREKDARGSLADDPETPVILATELIRREFPSVVVACDVCLCEYTSHGHCGELCPLETLTKAEQESKAKVIDNKASVKRMQEVSLAYARAGAHIVAPSDMMDGRIGAIKQALVDEGFGNRCSVMSYSAKFASNMYGPFREAAGSVPNFGDRKCYQLPPNARGLARRAILRDVAEGADFLMVKPALPYLDIMSEARELAPNHPLACYQVSGEFSMLHAGAQAGVYDLKAMAFETVEGFLRAGCTLVLTYFTPDFLDWLDEDR
ncbi:hypothetical protein JCM3774_004498 [Rhodotorula dairenensis]